MQDSQHAWSKNDHDVLIEVRTILVTSLNEMRNEMRDLRRANETQNLEHDNRLRKLEDMALQLDPIKKHEKYDDVVTWTEEFRARWKVYATIAGGIIAFVSTIVSAAIVNSLR